jgi:hypothetical protein
MFHRKRTPSRWRLRPPPPQAFRLALRLPRTTHRRGFDLEALRTRCTANLRQTTHPHKTRPIDKVRKEREPQRLYETARTAKPSPTSAAPPRRCRQRDDQKPEWLATDATTGIYARLLRPTVPQVALKVILSAYPRGLNSHHQRCRCGQSPSTSTWRLSPVAVSRKALS